MAEWILSLINIEEKHDDVLLATLAAGFRSARHFKSCVFLLLRTKRLELLADGHFRGGGEAVEKENAVKVIDLVLEGATE